MGTTLTTVILVLRGYQFHRASPMAQLKSLLVMQEMQETRVQSLVQEDPLEEAWQPTPVFLPGESQG